MDEILNLIESVSEGFPSSYFFSRFIQIVKLSSTSSQVVVLQLKVTMSRMGVCDTLVTD